MLLFDSNAKKVSVNCLKLSVSYKDIGKISEIVVTIKKGKGGDVSTMGHHVRLIDVAYS